MTGIYIHVPFCLRKCPYCDFYSLPYSDAPADEYVDAVLRAMKSHPFGQVRADTLYFGGGTPILLGPARLRRMLDAARETFSLTDDAEITVEANPAAAMRETLVQLREAGCNRLSFGVQSLEDGELTALGRPHDARQAVQAIRDAAEAGFDDISADLMLAIPGQTEESLARSIRGLTALPVNHISAYLLKIEPGTPFFDEADTLALPDEDEAAERYLTCVRLLEESGLHQYEISNFARGGRASRHNLKYWRCEEYLGIGPAAHSCFGGRRFFFARELAAFLAAPQPFTLIVDDGPGGGFEEEAMLGLRLSEGLTLSGMRAPPANAGAVLGKAKELAAHGLARVDGDTVALTPQGFLLSNSVIAALLGAG